MCSSDLVFDHTVQRACSEVIRHDVSGTTEPEIRNLMQNPTLIGNGIRQDDIKGGQAVSGHDEHRVSIDRVDIPHLALMDFFESSQGSTEDGWDRHGGHHCGANRARPGPCYYRTYLTNGHLLRPTRIGRFSRSFHLHSTRYARETIAKNGSMGVALATMPIYEIGSGYSNEVECRAACLRAFNTAARSAIWRECLTL